jgi:hypothetical protein
MYVGPEDALWDDLPAQETSLSRIGTTATIQTLGHRGT